jgi:guanylate kinase
VFDLNDPDWGNAFESGDASIEGLFNIRKPRVFIISGPSGVGKDAVLACLKQIYTEATYIVTATTRAMRKEEIHGRDYLFFTEEDFRNGIARGDFLEHQEVYPGKFYGVPRETVVQGLASGKDVIIKVEVNGHAKLRQRIDGATSIFIAPESMQSLYDRLLARKTETLQDFKTRIRTAADELKRTGEFDYVVFNEADALDECVQRICGIIESEFRRTNQPDVTVS